MVAAELVNAVPQCVPQLGTAELTELEDFALESARVLVQGNSDRNLVAALLQAFSHLGLDPAELIRSFRSERDEIATGMPRLQQLGPVAGFVLPTLKRCGLLSERVTSHYHDFLKGTANAEASGADLEGFMARIPGLPEDTAAWVLSELD